MKAQDTIYISIFPLNPYHPVKCSHKETQNFIAMVSGPGGDHSVMGCSTCMKSFVDTQKARGNCKVLVFNIDEGFPQ